jgi:hypothetical protein
MKKALTLIVVMVMTVLLGTGNAVAAGTIIKCKFILYFSSPLVYEGYLPTSDESEPYEFSIPSPAEELWGVVISTERGIIGAIKFNRYFGSWEGHPTYHLPENSSVRCKAFGKMFCISRGRGKLTIDVQEIPNPTVTDRFEMLGNVSPEDFRAFVGGLDVITPNDFLFITKRSQWLGKRDPRLHADLFKKVQGVFAPFEALWAMVYCGDVSTCSNILERTERYDTGEPLFTHGLHDFFRHTRHRRELRGLRQRVAERTYFVTYNENLFPFLNRDEGDISYLLAGKLSAYTYYFLTLDSRDFRLSGLSEADKERIIIKFENIKAWVMAQKGTGAWHYSPDYGIVRSLNLQEPIKIENFPETVKKWYNGPIIDIEGYLNKYKGFCVHVYLDENIYIDFMVTFHGYKGDINLLKDGIVETLKCIEVEGGFEVLKQGIGSLPQSHTPWCFCVQLEHRTGFVGEVRTVYPTVTDCNRRIRVIADYTDGRDKSTAILSAFKDFFESLS